MAGWRDVAARNAHHVDAKKQPSRSLFEQVRDAATGVIPGLAHVAAEGAHQIVTAPLHLVHGAVTGDLGEMGRGVPIAGQALSIATGHAKQDLPLSFSLGESMQRTGGDVLHPSRFAKAVEEGRIVDKVLEDVGNVALVAGPAAAGFRAAGTAAEGAGLSGTARLFRGAETGARAVGHAAGRTADLPVAPLRLAGRAVLGKVGEFAEAARPAVAAGEAGRLQQFAARHLTGADPVRRGAIRLVREAEPQRTAAMAGAQGEVASQLRQVEGDRPLFEAARARTMGLDEPIRQFVAAEKQTGQPLDFGEAMGHVQPVRVPGYHVGPEAQALLRDFHAGTLPAEQVAALEGLTERMRGVQQGRTNQALEGYGYTKGESLDPAQTGTAPLDQGVLHEDLNDPQIYAAKFRPAMRGVEGLRQYLTAPARGEGFDTGPPRPISEGPIRGGRYSAAQAIQNEMNPGVNPHAPSVEQILEDPNYAPRIDEIMRATAAWAANRPPVLAPPAEPRPLADFAAQLPRTPEQLTAAGVTPEHVTGGQVGLGPETTAVRSNAGIGPERRLAGQQQRSEGSLTAMEPKLVAQRESQQAGRAVQNETVKKLTAPMELDAAGKPVIDPATGAPQGGFARTVRDVLGDGALTEIDQRMSAQIADQGIQARLGLRRQLYGETLTQEMAKRGLEPWDPTREGFLADPAAVSDNTPFLPKGLAEKVRAYSVAKDPGAILSALGKVNRAFKGAVLPLSPRWYLGDVVSHYLFSATLGSVDPFTLASKIGEARRAIAAGEIPREVLQGSLSVDDARTLGHFDDLEQPRSRIRRGVRAAQQKGFGLNRTLNDMHRAALYLEDVQRNIGKGLESEAAITRAVRKNAYVLGDIHQLNPFERRVVTQIVPFYSWLKTVNTLAGRLAIDHPARLIWTLHLGSTWGDQEGLPDWAKGGLPIGNAVLPLNALNPASDLASGSLLMPFSQSGQFDFGAGAAARSLSPALKVGVAGGFGMNLSREGFDLTRGGKDATDQYGRPIPVKLFGPSHLGELAGFAARQVPLFRTAQEVGPSVGQFGPGLRFDTGEVRASKRGKRQTGDPVLGGRADVVGRQFVPFYPQALGDQAPVKKRRPG